MNKLLLKSIVTVATISLALFLAINALILFVQNTPSWAPMAVLFAVVFYMLVSVDYQRRKYLESCKK